MAKEILVPIGLKSAIQEQFGYSLPTIRRALAGEDMTRAKRVIRAYALEHGGIERQ